MRKGKREKVIKSKR